MALLRRILWHLRLLKRVRPAGYSAEVLYAGWVDAPKPRPKSVSRR